MSETPDLPSLLIQTGHAHHEAFIETNGTDPEWPLWYAGYLFAKLRRLGYRGTQAELVAALVEADRAHQATAPDAPWPQFYAPRLLPD